MRVKHVSTAPPPRACRENGAIVRAQIQSRAIVTPRAMCESKVATSISCLAFRTADSTLSRLNRGQRVGHTCGSSSLADQNRCQNMDLCKCDNFIDTTSHLQKLNLRESEITCAERWPPPYLDLYKVHFASVIPI